jgi:hypothetical protein
MAGLWELWAVGNNTVVRDGALNSGPTQKLGGSAIYGCMIYNGCINDLRQAGRDRRAGWGSGSDPEPFTKRA